MGLLDSLSDVGSLVQAGSGLIDQLGIGQSASSGGSSTGGRLGGLTKAYLQPETGSRIDCLFNPAKLEITKEAEWAWSELKGKNLGQPEFQQGKAAILKLDLIFDTTHTGRTVTEHTDRLLELASVNTNLPDADRSRAKARPPKVSFHWGDFHSFEAVVSKLVMKFTFFDTNGTPLRASAEIILKQVKDEKAWARQNPTSGVEALHTIHRVQTGETLDRLAARYYGEAAKWRRIAEANGVIDPLAIEPGTQLLIPEPEVVRRD
ncbi:MAG: LysM peptidoglycan-binding domain-containing protein [bacterium]|nr:LysM peptidoglycan-binding domain-containing protein [bacterium]